MSKSDAEKALGKLGAQFSPDFDAYAAGEIPAHGVRCVLCSTSPCSCPEFGSPDHFALVRRRHGKA